MKRTLFTLMTLAVMIGFSPLVFGADGAKIGVVDFEKILKESSAGKLIQNEMNKKGEEFKAKLKIEKDSLDELSKAFEREALVLSPEKKAEKERDFRIRVNDFKKMQEDFAREFKGIEIQHINQMQKDVFEIANEMGKKDGYLLIIEKKTAGVIYLQAHVDITDAVITKYNTMAAKTN